MQTTPPWANLVRAVALASLAIVAVLVAMALGSIRDTTAQGDIDGPWVVTAPESVAGRTVSLPFSFRDLGLTPSATVAIQAPLTLDRPVDDPAILVERPRYHLAVRWDDHPIARAGRSADHGEGATRDRLVVRLPPALVTEGDHRLTITIQGDHGQGGLGGRVRFGEAPALEAEADGHLAESLALAAMLCMASVLGLVLASVRPSLEEFLWFGVFCAAAAADAFASDDGWWLVGHSLDLKLRVDVAAYALLPGSGLMFVQHWLGNRRGRGAVVLMNAGFLVATFSLLWPSTAVLPIVARVNDIVAATAMVFVVITVARALRDRVEGAPAIALSVLLLAGVAIADHVAMLAGWPEPRVVLPGFLLFIGTATAALVLRSADLADRYRQLVDSARDAIFVVQPDGSVEEVNTAAEILLAADPRGRPLWGLVFPEDRDLAREHVASHGAGPRRAELRIVGAGGRIVPVESVATDVPEGRVMLVMRDISARRQVEEGMLHAARMETVGIIAGGIAHDFNNTMTALMAHIGLLRLKLQDETDRQRLTRMEGVIRRASHMTRRLLTLARGGRAERARIDIAQPVHSAVELTRSMLPRNITIRERVDPGLPAVLGSEDDLEQAVLNLLVNARDALAATGGTIRVRVRVHREAGLPAGVRIDVEDDGPGVPESVRSLIWEPFFTT
ncbi:MAG: PAS domain S-box protein, partial [Deltaproteobacteria bacterium]